MFMWDGSPFAINSAAMLSCRLAYAAGACSIAAGIWNSAKGKSWPLVLNGLALSAYGLIPLFWRGSLSFHLFACLLAVTALTTGLLSLTIARILRRHRADEWFFRGAGLASVGFALALSALASGWIQLERRLFHPSLFLWFACYFGFSAICMRAIALRLRNIGSYQLPLGNPRHAH
jgi:hypothetical protein